MGSTDGSLNVFCICLLPLNDIGLLAPSGDPRRDTHHRDAEGEYQERQQQHEDRGFTRARMAGRRGHAAVAELEPAQRLASAVPRGEARKDRWHCEEGQDESKDDPDGDGHVTAPEGETQYRDETGKH